MGRTAVSPQHEAIARWFFLIISVLVGYLFWKTIQPFALVLMTAGIMAVVLTPFEQRLRSILRRKGLSAALVVLVVLILIVGPLVLAGFLMIDQAIELIRNLVSEDGWATSFNLTKLPFASLLPESVITQLAAVDIRAVLLAIAEWTSQHLAVIFASSADFLFKTFIFFVCFYYFLVDRERIVAQILSLSPFQDKTDNSILDRMAKTVRAVVTGSLIVALVQGILSAIGMTIFGVPGALLWAALVVIAANIPFVGTAGVLLPAVVYLVLSGHPNAALGLLIWAVVVVGLVDNLLKPFLVEGKTRMHPLLILLTILGGLQVFGPIGLIVGPTILAAFLSLIELYRAGVLERRQL